MSNASNPNEFETYARQVEPGLGFPNGRDSVSPEPTGWVRSVSNDVVNVSRETFSGIQVAPDTGEQAVR